MSNVYEAKTKCPCGSQVIAAIKRPTWFTPFIAPVSCPECLSKFLLKCSRNKDEREEKTFKVTFEIVELSDKAIEALTPKAEAEKELGCSQVARQQTVNLPIGGSIPSSPANSGESA